MMQTAMAALREPEAPQGVEAVRALVHAPDCRGAGAEPLAANAVMPSIPGPDFYRKADGSWSEEASVLEAQLVRRFGRMLRREAATAWRTTATANAPQSSLAVTVHDFELPGDAAVPPAATAEVRIALHGEDASRMLAVAAEPRTRSLIIADAVLDFGPAEHFLFDGASRAAGRIALDLRRVGAADLAQERAASAQWSTSKAAKASVGLGSAIASQLLAACYIRGE